MVEAEDDDLLGRTCQPRRQDNTLAAMLDCVRVARSLTREGIFASGSDGDPRMLRVGIAVIVGSPKHFVEARQD